MDRSEAVANVAADLYATEKAVDDAILHATSLIQSMIAGRAALNLSPVSGAESQAKVMETLAALSSARECIVASHAEMQKDHRRMGWGTFAAGPTGKPKDADDSPMVGGKVAQLRVA